MRPLLALLLIPCFLTAQESVDLSVINRIKNEAFTNSKVMDNAFYLTDVYGPRLTGSPGLKSAGDWAVGRMKEWGLANPHLETWGPFGRGWTNVRFSAHLKAPGYAPIIGFARPWSPGTKGPISGEPIVAPIAAEADFAKWKGKLRGKIVMLRAARPLTPLSSALMHRHSDDELAKLGIAPDPTERERTTDSVA